MTREEIEQAFKNKETVYDISTDINSAYEIDFSKVNINKYFDDGFNFYIESSIGYNGKLLIFCEYENVNKFETKEDAEFVARNWKTRVERFEPPLWEDFLKTESYSFISKNGWKEHIYICKEDIHNKRISSGNRFMGSVTKENYIKAVEYARKLFEGEEK